MAGFVSSPPQTAALGSAGDRIEHDGWFPGVSRAEARDVIRLATTITDARLSSALLFAMVTVTRELKAWKAAHVAAGHASLEEVPGEELDRGQAYEHLYKTAVFHFAGAQLVETHHDISATPEARDRHEVRVVSVDEFRRVGIHAIRDILGVPRTTVELI